MGYDQLSQQSSHRWLLVLDHQVERHPRHRNQEVAATMSFALTLTSAHTYSTMTLAATFLQLASLHRKKRNDIFLKAGSVAQNHDFSFGHFSADQSRTIECLNLFSIMSSFPVTDSRSLCNAKSTAIL